MKTKHTQNTIAAALTARNAPANFAMRDCSASILQLMRASARTAAAEPSAKELSRRCHASDRNASAFRKLSNRFAALASQIS
jgi:hypothetical protein